MWWRRFDLSAQKVEQESEAGCRMDTLFRARSHVARMRKAFSGLNAVSRWVSGWVSERAFVSNNIKEPNLIRML